MNKALICFIIAAVFLLPTVNCITVSVKTNVGDFTEHLGSGIDDTINGNTAITRDTLSNAVWGVSPTGSKSNNRGTLSYKNDKSASDGAGNTALTHIGITNAKSYTYCQYVSKPGSFAAAAEFLDVTGAKSIDAWAKVYNTKVAGLDVSVSTTVNSGDLHGYNNMAIASANLGYAFQSFDSATGTTVKCDSVAKNLPKKYSDAQDKDPKYTEASISTTAMGTVTNYEDAVVKSSLGTSTEQNALISGSFISSSTAGTGASKVSKTRNSNYGTKYGLDMQANIASGSPSVKGTMTYYVNPNMNIKGATNGVINGAIAASQAGDLIGLAAGTYTEDVNIDKAVTVRGDDVKVNSVTNLNNAGKVYLNSRKVLLRADDFGNTDPAGWSWFADLSKIYNFKVTYATMPGSTDLNTVKFMSSLDKNNYEIATHGLHHEDYAPNVAYDTQLGLISQATQLLTTYFVRPRTFVTPYDNGDENTVLAAKALGYHSISQNQVEPVQGISQFAPNFIWEDVWTGNDATHDSEADFEKDFSKSTERYYTVEVHPATYSHRSPDGSLDGSIKSEDASEFVKSIVYLKSQNVEFMTMEQAYEWQNGMLFAQS